MEVAKKVSESLNMFYDDSNGKINLVNLLLDDPHMIYVTTDEKVIQLLRIKAKDVASGQKKQGHLENLARASNTRT
jgi:hypothetical protein